jgi:hypothetical protein
MTGKKKSITQSSIGATYYPRSEVWNVIVLVWNIKLHDVQDEKSLTEKIDKVDEKQHLAYREEEIALREDKCHQIEAEA